MIRLRRLASKILVGLLAAIFAIGLCEGGLRLFHYRPTISNAWILDFRQRVLDEDVLTLDVNFRDDAFYQPYREPLRGSAKVIVALGDSFTQGFPVARRNSYPAVLERILRERGQDVRVLNIGLGDTGPDQQLKLFTKYVLPRIHPDIVIWQLYPNDSRDNAVRPLYAIKDDRLVPISARDNWEYRRLRLYRAIPLPAAVKRHSYLFNLLMRLYERERFAQVPAGMDPIGWGRRKIELEVKEMAALGQQHGFRVYYTLIAPWSLYFPDLPDYGTDEYKELLPILERQPNFISGEFPAASSNPGLELFADGKRDGNPPGGRHLNEAGYALLARTIADRL